MQINRWLNYFSATEEYESVCRRYFNSTNPIKRAQRGIIAENVSPYDNLLKKHAAELGWDWRMLAAVVYQESKFSINSRSHRGATGLMQVMPGNGVKYGVTDLINPEYNKSLKRAAYYRRMGKQKWEDLSPEQRKERNRTLKMLEAKQRTLSPSLPLDDSYKRVQYVRYADDFIIGVIGSKADAEQIKQDVGQFLKDVLDLEMSDAKTKVTHTGDRARFLGYDITVSRSQNLKMSAAGYKLRSNTGVVKLLVPREKWVNKLLEYNAIKIKINENGKERFVRYGRCPRDSVY